MSSSSASVSAPTPTPVSLKRRADELKPSKADINFVVLDFLISEGFPRAADLFAKEADLKLPVEEDTIQARVDIRKAIHAGAIDDAINMINNINPEILDHDPALHFALLRLQLIELIRTCTNSPKPDILPAVNFSSSQLAPRAATNPEFQKDLELTMSLLILLPEGQNQLQKQFVELLQPSLRRDVAGRVNEAILLNYGQQREARLRNLVRLRHWAEQKAKMDGKDGVEVQTVPSYAESTAPEFMVQ